MVTPLGVGIDGQVYNINADIAACKIAEAIHARKLVFLSDVPGVLADCENPDSVIPTIRTDEIDGARAAQGPLRAACCRRSRAASKR